MSTIFYSSIDSFKTTTPPFEEIIKPYKALAKSFTQFEKLTEKQHQLAKYYGFKDWQSFQYQMKSMYDEISTIDLSSREWAFVFDVCNGLFLEIDLNEIKQRLLVEIIDGDRYNALSYKWFGKSSQAWEDQDGEYYEPCKPMKEFLEKLKKLNESQIGAVAMKGLHYWNRCFAAASKEFEKLLDSAIVEKLENEAMPDVMKEPVGE